MSELVPGPKCKYNLLHWENKGGGLSWKCNSSFLVLQLHCQMGTSRWEANICKELDVIPTPPYTGDQMAWVLCAPTAQGHSYTPHTSVFPES